MDNAVKSRFDKWIFEYNGDWTVKFNMISDFSGGGYMISKKYPQIQHFFTASINRWNGVVHYKKFLKSCILKNELEKANLLLKLEILGDIK